jgi:hypothetical protein
MDLSEFLMCRYDDIEDDQDAAAVEHLRMIVTECTDAITEGNAESTVWLAQRVLLVLVHPFRDSPDFRSEWAL